MLDVIPSGKESGFTLSEDGTVTLKARKKSVSVLTGIDYELPFQLDEQDMCLIVPQNYKKVDIVADGRYLSNGKKYVLLPKWIRVFLAPILIMIIAEGFIDAVIGLLGFTICQKAAKSSLNMLIRIVIYVVIMASAWVLYLGIAVVLQPVINR